MAGLFDIDLDILQDKMRKVGDIFDSGYNIYDSIRGRREANDILAQDSQNLPIAYNPNLTFSDLAISPNWYLLLGGAAVLVAVAMISRK